MEFFRQLGAAVIAFLVAHGYLALFLLLLVEEAGVPLPLPGDTLVMYSAYQAQHGHLNGFGVLASAIAGSFVGSLILYFIALKGGHALLLRYGRYIRLNPRRIERMERRFQRWGIWAIIVARMIPGLRIATTVMAGVFAIPPRVFIPADFAGICIWAVVYYILGVVVGEGYMSLSETFGGYLRWFLLVGGIIIALIVLTVYLRRRNSESEPEPESESSSAKKPLVLVPEREPGDDG